MVEALGNQMKWHMLEHLQKKKVKKAVQLFDMVYEEIKDSGFSFVEFTHFILALEGHSDFTFILYHRISRC